MSSLKRLAPRLALTGLIVAAAVSGAGLAVANAGQKADSPNRPNATQPSTSNAPASAPGVTSPERVAVPVAAIAPGLHTVDWKNATLKLPRFQTDRYCAGGVVTFRNGLAVTKTGTYRILRPGKKAVYGQLTGDRLDEAVLPVDCSPPNSEYASHLVGVTGRPGALRVLGDAITTENWGISIDSVRITGGQALVTLTERLTDHPRTQIRGYAWTGTEFQQVSGPTKFPEPVVDGTNFEWSTATLTLPFKAASTTVQPNNRSCPRVTVKFTHVQDGVGAVQSNGCEYWVHKIATVDLNGDGSADSLVKITATRLGTGDLTTGAEWYFAYTFRNGKPALISFVTAAGLDNVNDNAKPDVTATSVRASIREVRVTQVFRSPGKPNQTLNRTFRWSGGTRFAVNMPAPNPRADLAP